jgi:hypothetical protein
MCWLVLLVGIAGCVHESNLIVGSHTSFFSCRVYPSSHLLLALSFIMPPPDLNSIGRSVHRPQVHPEAGYQAENQLLFTLLVLLFVNEELQVCQLEQAERFAAEHSSLRDSIPRLPRGGTKLTARLANLKTLKITNAALCAKWPPQAQSDLP